MPRNTNLNEYGLCDGKIDDKYKPFRMEFCNECKKLITVSENYKSGDECLCTRCYLDKQPLRNPRTVGGI